MMELLVLVVVLLAASAFGLWRRATDGRLASVPPPDASPPTDAPGLLAEVDVGQPGDSVQIAVGDPGPERGEPVPGTAPDVLGADELGQPLGEQASLVQFSSAFCTPCRATRVVLADVAAMVPGVVHVEIDAESNLDLVRRLDVTRTPTVLVLDSAGLIRSRATGAPRKADVIAVLGHVV